MLDLPDIRQRTDWDCGAACVEAVVRFYGRPLPQLIPRLATPTDGTQPDTLKAAFYAALGPNVVSAPMTLGILRGFIADGKPVVCAVIPEGEETGHWVVVRGVTPKRVYYHCPTNGRESLPHGEWLACWRDDDDSPWQQWGISAWPAK